MRSGARRYWLWIALFGVAVFLIAQPSYVGWWSYQGALGPPFWDGRCVGSLRAARCDPLVVATGRGRSVHGGDARWPDEGGVRITFFAIAAGVYTLHVHAPMPAVGFEEQPHRLRHDRGAAGASGARQPRSAAS